MESKREQNRNGPSNQKDVRWHVKKISFRKLDYKGLHYLISGTAGPRGFQLLKNANNRTMIIVWYVKKIALWTCTDGSVSVRRPKRIPAPQERQQPYYDYRVIKVNKAKKEATIMSKEATILWWGGHHGLSQQKGIILIF
ncbi:hypothetical protein GH714_018505 [Hevea brasiliensis]|uniref:Uncharacterized protein n=1 Tax=Hevea brasiliensis TaxID=3981 RepID=A0A6A6MNT3_HEVBR|nr:hypothetical protein GH714_018505 [Hevea brasiliensis]